MKKDSEVDVEEILRGVSFFSTESPDTIFEVLGGIGKGNYGVVLKARHRQTGELYAVKQTALTEPLDVESAVREIRVMMSCEHPNITMFHGAYRSPTAIWLVMEYMNGGSIDNVRRHLKQNLSEPLIAYILHETLVGLRYIHAGHKIHRDVKAGNILFNRAGEVKLADFGISAQMGHTLSRRNSYWGTMLYMAPEIMSDSDYDQKADMWSLGITALEMAEGCLPFARLQRYPLVELLTKKPPPTLQHKERFSPQFQLFLMRLLTKDKYSRPSAAAMLEDSFLLRDFTSAKEELGAMVDAIQTAIETTGKDGCFSSDDESEEATFIQRRSGRRMSVMESPDNGVDGAPGAAAEQDHTTDGLWGPAGASMPPPIPIVATQSISFDALHFASSNINAMNSKDFCALLTRATPSSAEGVAGATASRTPHTLTYSTQVLQNLYIYYDQLPSMRCLTRKEASTTVACRSNLGAALRSIYHVIPPAPPPPPSSTPSP